MPHQFTPYQFILDTWRTDVRGTDFALVTSGPAEDSLENPVLNALEVFQQRHMVHCTNLGVALENGDLEAKLVTSGSSDTNLNLQSQPWPPLQIDTLLTDLDADVVQHMQPAAQQQRPAFTWLSAVPDDVDTASLSSNLRAFLLQQLEHAATLFPGHATTLIDFVEGSEVATAHHSLRHPSWPSNMELTYELAATHAAAAAGASPPFAGDSPGGPLQFEFELAAVVQSYAAARGRAAEQVQLAVLGTRQFREKRQHILVMCLAQDSGLAGVFESPLLPIQQYNLQQQESAGEVVAQPDSDGGGLTWWVQSTMAPVAEDQERTLPWKTFLNIDPAAKGACAFTAAAHSLGNYKWDALDVALYFPDPGALLQLPVSRVRLRRAAALRPTATGSVPREDEERAPSVDAVHLLAAADVPMLAAPELVIWLKEGAGTCDEVLEAIDSAGAIKKASPKKPCAAASPVPQQVGPAL